MVKENTSYLDLVTPGEIVRDMKTHHRFSGGIGVILLVLVLLGAALMGWCAFGVEAPLGLQLLFGFFGGLFLLLAGYTVVEWIGLHRRMNLVLNCQYRVEKLPLSLIDNSKIHGNPRQGTYAPMKLKFLNKGGFLVDANTRLYRWSELYATNGTGLFRVNSGT